MMMNFNPIRSTAHSTEQLKLCEDHDPETSVEQLKRVIDCTGRDSREDHQTQLDCSRVRASAERSLQVGNSVLAAEIGSKRQTLKHDQFSSLEQA